MKKLIAARVAAQMSAETGTEVRTVRGGLGELSVDIDGVRVVETNRLLYATPASILRKVREHLAHSKGHGT